MLTRRNFLKSTVIAGGSLFIPLQIVDARAPARKVQPPVGLTPFEIEGITFMREEEKLARDVYIALYKKWGATIFYNISGSEQHHTDAVGSLIVKYHLIDPFQPQLGVFTNQQLQYLYNDLILKGTQSLLDAVEVGLMIEEIDILDLEKFLSLTDKADIQQVFTNLVNGSFNHLRAFSSQYTRLTGKSYIPLYLSQAEYDAIMDGSSSGGGCNGGGRGS